MHKSIGILTISLAIAYLTYAIGSEILNSSNLDSNNQKTNELTKAPKNCILTTFAAPQHGFIDLYCPASFSNNTSQEFLKPVSKIVGYYPNDGNDYDFIMNSLKGLVIKNFNTRGNVLNDVSYKNRCINSLNCASADFIISRQQANNVLNFINDRQIECKRGEIKNCYYSLLDKNCINFVSEVTNAAGIKENWMQKLKIKESITQPLFSFDYKAWAYIYLTTYSKIQLSKRLF